MKAKFKNVLNFINRQAVTIALIAISLYFLRPATAELQTFLFIITTEAIALALSGIALFVYTKIPFTKLILEEQDKKIARPDRSAVIIVLGLIFIGVHILTGLIVLGVYIAMFTH